MCLAGVYGSFSNFLPLAQLGFRCDRRRCDQRSVLAQQFERQFIDLLPDLLSFQSFSNSPSHRREMYPGINRHLSDQNLGLFAQGGESNMHLIEVLPGFRPPGWRIFRAWAHGGWDAPEPFMSDIGALLPMALCRKTLHEPKSGRLGSF